MSELGQEVREVEPSTTEQPPPGPRETSLRRRFVDSTHNAVVARAILLLALLLTGLAWWFSHVAVQRAVENRFEFRAQEIESAVVDRMLGYENVLWSGVGLFDASDGLSRAQFAEYVATLDLEGRWPGIQGIGWSIPLDPAEVASHQASIRAEGFPDYALSPEGDRDQYSAIVFLEPFDWRNQRAFGFDMWSNPERREAMVRARDSGQAATSSMITLVQETDEDVQRGFLTYVPVYDGGEAPDTIEGRRQALLGWVYAPFRMNDLMEGILGSSTDDVDYQIFDGDRAAPEALLYDSNPDSAAPGDDGLGREVTVMVQGHPWTMAFRTGSGFSLDSERMPTYVAIAGLLIEALLFYVITALGTLNRRAEAIAHERTIQLRVTNEVLQERSEELERQAVELTRSNDELRQFAHVASHDLQEPLRTMASYSSLVSSTYGDELTDEGRRWLDYINDSAKRLSDLIREILQFSTVDVLNRDQVVVDLNQIMELVGEDLDELITTASAEVSFEELPLVNGEPTQLRRLLTNLVHNALTYRRPGVTPRIVVKASSNGDLWRIHVRDNGVGIDPQFQERIFELFRRVAPKDQHPGTGMGLAICRKIVRAHGGDIGVASAPGNGTEFWFDLPPANDPRRDGDRRAGAAADATTPAPGRSRGSRDQSAKEFL